MCLDINLIAMILKQVKLVEEYTQKDALKY